MIATDFKYDNEKLSDYQLMLCEFDNDSNTISVGNSLTFNTVQPSGSDKSILANAKYNEDGVLTAKLQVCKNTCLQITDSIITLDELSYITRWLGRKEYHEFRIYQDEYEDIFFNGSFNDFNVITVDGKICGLEFTFVADSPYGYLDTVSLDFTTTTNASYNITNLSHETGILYPKKFTCKCLTGGNLEIYNAIEDRKTVINNCIKDEIISLEGENKIIESNVKTHLLYNDFNYKYFRLANSYYNNINSITTSLPCEIHIEYNPIRKVGII